MPRKKSKKRPCRICRKWFTPNPLVGARQKTCGDSECMRKWHNRNAPNGTEITASVLRKIIFTIS